MLRKCTLILSVIVAFGVPTATRAQTTMDAAMQIQALLDQLSETRSKLKQFQASINIEKMKQNLSGGNLKDKLKKAEGMLKDLDKAKKAAQALPGPLKDLVEKGKDTTAWLKKNLTKKKDDSFSSEDELHRRQTVFKYSNLALAYGRAVALRKQLDRDLAKVEQMRQNAQDSASEMDLKAEMNTLEQMKLSQTQAQQLLIAARAQMDATSTIIAAEGETVDEGEEEEETCKEGDENCKKEEKETSYQAKSTGC